MKLEYKQKYRQASRWPSLDAGNIGEAGWRIELRPEATCEKLAEQPCRWNHLWLLNFFETNLLQGVKVQYGRANNMDSSLCKANKINLCLVQLGPGQEDQEGGLQTGGFEEKQ